LTNTSGSYSYYNSSNYSQDVLLLNFSKCIKTFNVTYLNISFKDESTLFWINSSISAFTANYYVGSGNVVKSFSYSNSTELGSFDFCLSPGWRTLHFTDGVITYSATGYPARGFSSFNPTYTNTTTNTTLYLLSSTSGSYVTFQVINDGQNVVVGALVTASSSLGAIESRITDAAGSVTFFMDPLVPYTLVTSKSGYLTNTVTITPTQPAYTITLSRTSSGSVSDLLKGISYYTLPVGSELNNGTTYQFNFTINSTYWALDYFGMILSNGTSTLAAAESANPLGGTVSAVLNTGNNRTIHMNYYWSVNGTVFNASSSSFRSWTVTSTWGQAWSLRIFFEDLQLYMSSGLFGLTPTGLGMIIFLTIFVITGVLTYKFGFTSPAAIMMVIFGLVGFFDMFLQLIPAVGGIQHGVPTFITAMMMVAMLIWEWSR